MKRLFNLFFQWNRFSDTLYSQRNRAISDMTTLESLKFDNIVLKKLPIDKEEKSYVRTVNGACFSRVKPTPLKNPTLVASSLSALSLLDLSEQEINRKEFVEYFSGNKLLSGSDPAAHCYCGHQFGYFSGQLGDGAVIYLGEVVNQKNERWEIQLKGAGLTPYSRTADGRKVLRSSIREFLCSEAMYFLGIPTSRAGSCITSDSEVIRDIFYDGRNKPEKCTVVLRIAQTFIRFGSFEIFKTLDPMTGKVGPSVGRTDILHILLNYVIDTFYPEISESVKEQTEKYQCFFKEVVLRTARLVALWQSVGFCHGVLNTDNMSIVGLTIDYGPFGFLDIYNPNHVCNASDDGGRYSFIKQPEICLWNLKKFAEAIQQALPIEISMATVELFQPEFESTYLRKMRDKLGLFAKEFPEDKKLIQELFDTMEETGSDFTNTFLCFSSINVNAIQESSEVVIEKLLEQRYSLETMMDVYDPKISMGQAEMFVTLANSDPEIFEEAGSFGLHVQRVLGQMKKLRSLETMTVEGKNENDKILWEKWLQQYLQRIEEDMKSYKGDIETYSNERLNIMKNSNPRFILRNYILQEAIEMAEKGDFSRVRKLVQIVEKPYEFSDVETIINKVSEVGELEKKDSSSTGLMPSCEIFHKAPHWSSSIRVT